MFDRLRSWLGRSDAEPPSRLSKEDALRIAREGASATHDVRLLTLVRRDVRAGRVVWVVSEAVIGSALVVEVDDATGDVIAVRRTGGR
jgi:hypothetical protein